VMLDWLGKMIGLPDEFLACSGGKGGGVIQGTASEATLVALLGAKARAIADVKREKPEMSDADIVAKLVGYTSSKTHRDGFGRGLIGVLQVRATRRWSARGSSGASS
jgi:aromatic-L-amino-acid decarboxylase